MARELEQWEHGLENSQRQPPFLHAHAEYESSKQMLNPLKVLTSGVEQRARCRFSRAASGALHSACRGGMPTQKQRRWSLATTGGGSTRSTGGGGGGDADLFASTHPFVWRYGQRGNVFCVDFQRAGAGWSASQEPWWATISSWLHCAGPSGCCSLTMGTFRPPRALAYSRAL